MIGVSLGASGCASTPAALRQVTHFDLACDRVSVVKLSDGTYAASGCGRGAVYAPVCDAGGCRYGRLRNGHEAEVSGVAPAVPVQSGARIVQPAPPPAEREVLPAPPPGGVPAREIIPAPPPAAPAAAAPEAAPVSANDTASVITPTAGDLSAPYQTQVPLVQTSQQSVYPPPAPLIETRPYRPAPNYVWINGYWWWGASTWLWLPGYWSAPYYGYAYVPGRWYWSAGSWWYGPGGWASPGSTVIMRAAERPNAVATVRALAPVRVAAGGGGVVHPTGGVVRPGGAGLAGQVGQGGTGTGAGGRGATGVARVGPSFAPSASPLYRYPEASQRPAAGAPTGLAAGFAPGAGSVGRVVTPGATPHQSGARHGGSGPVQVSPQPYGGGGSRAPVHGGAPHTQAPNPSYVGVPHTSGPRPSMPAPSAAPSHGGGGFRGGGSAVHVGGGGGGRRH